MHSLSCAGSKQAQAGITIVEILFTVFLMSVGLLGLTALQVKTLNNVSNNHTATEVNFYLQDMAERIRSNRSGNYDNLTHNTTAGATIASQDAAAWGALLSQAEQSGGLPSGATGSVSLSGNLYTILISWQEQRKDKSASATRNKSASLTVRI
jgi:type IV pilus assembly protein PilV